MIAYYLHQLSPFLIEFGNGIGVRWYGLAYVLGFICGYWVLVRLARRGLSEVPVEKVGDYVFGLALFGVLLGGRLGYALFYDFQSVMDDPLRLLRVWEGGMSSHGGMIGVALFTLWYARAHHISWMGLGDNIAVVAPIGIFFGRLANFVNGELYGRVTQVAWAIQFPSELIEDPALGQRATLACMTKVDPSLHSPELVIAAARESEPVQQILREVLHPRHPSQLYAAFLEGALLFGLSWFLRTRLKLRNGVTIGIFFIAYAVVRIFGEQFRQPDAGVAFTLGLTRGQFLSVFLVLLGTAFLIAASRQPKVSKNP